MNLKGYDWIVLPVLGGCYLFCIFIWGLATFSGYNACINTNSIGEHWFELAMLVVSFPFVFRYFKEEAL